jgi:hypothetical protein
MNGFKYFMTNSVARLPIGNVLMFLEPANLHHKLSGLQVLHDFFSGGGAAGQLGAPV